MRPLRAQAVRISSVLAAGTLLVLAAAQGAGVVEPIGSTERRQLAQAQGPRPDAAPGEDGKGTTTSPLKWLRYSSERFRTLMRMLATRSARYEAKQAAEAKAAEATKRAAEAWAAEEARLAEAAKRAAEAKAAEDAKRAAEARAAEEARQVEAAKRAAEAKAAEDAKRAPDAKAAEDAKRLADARVAEEARQAEEAKRAADAKAAEDAKRAAEARKAVEITKAAEADKASAAKQPADSKVVAETKRPAPASERSKRAPATCKNAGVKISGTGWYVAQVGDSLWSIARAHYGYGKAYHRIHAANRRRIPNANRIYPCQRIYMPRSMSGEAIVQDQRVALAPFVRRRPIPYRLQASAPVRRRRRKRRPTQQAGAPRCI